MSRSVQLKEEGNRHFLNGDFVSAEALYSKALIADPKNPVLYTNRAMARLKMSLWDSAVADCTDCLALAQDNMKAHYYLSQAKLALRDFPAAVAHALRAHELCVASDDKSLAAVTAQVLRCKKERWEDAERRRRREWADLEDELASLLGAECDRAAAEADGDAERDEVRAECDQKAARLRDVFERARAAGERRREVPDWAIDDISFGIMVDPVITKTGKSYERASIVEHLKRHPVDPLTREPLKIEELRPNLALRQACEDFLNENGWAVDW